MKTFAYIAYKGGEEIGRGCIRGFNEANLYYALNRMYGTKKQGITFNVTRRM